MVLVQIKGFDADMAVFFFDEGSQLIEEAVEFAIMMDVEIRGNSIMDILMLVTHYMAAHI